MNAFDKLCGAVAFLLGIILLVLGVIGLVAGCRANFTLPPVLGVIPAFVGWGIVRAVYLAWNRPQVALELRKREWLERAEENEDPT